MSVSCRSCVYWHRCCRIISTLSTSSRSSSYRGRREDQRPLSTSHQAGVRPPCILCTRPCLWIPNLDDPLGSPEETVNPQGDYEGHKSVSPGSTWNSAHAESLSTLTRTQKNGSTVVPIGPKHHGTTRKLGSVMLSSGRGSNRVCAGASSPSGSLASTRS